MSKKWVDVDKISSIAGRSKQYVDDKVADLAGTTLDAIEDLEDGKQDTIYGYEGYQLAFDNDSNPIVVPAYPQDNFLPGMDFANSDEFYANWTRSDSDKITVKNDEYVEFEEDGTISIDLGIDILNSLRGKFCTLSFAGTGNIDTASGFLSGTSWGGYCNLPTHIYDIDTEKKQLAYDSRKCSPTASDITGIRVEISGEAGARLYGVKLELGETQSLARYDYYNGYEIIPQYPARAINITSDAFKDKYISIPEITEDSTAGKGINNVVTYTANGTTQFQHVTPNKNWLKDSIFCEMPVGSEWPSSWTRDPETLNFGSSSGVAGDNVYVSFLNTGGIISTKIPLSELPIITNVITISAFGDGAFSLSAHLIQNGSDDLISIDDTYGNLNETVTSPQVPLNKYIPTVISLTGHINIRNLDLSQYSLYISVNGYTGGSVYAPTSLYGVKLESGYHQTLAFLRQATPTYSVMSVIPQFPDNSDGSMVVDNSDKVSIPTNDNGVPGKGPGNVIVYDEDGNTQFQPITPNPTYLKDSIFVELPKGSEWPENWSKSNETNITLGATTSSGLYNRPMVHFGASGTIWTDIPLEAFPFITEYFTISVLGIGGFDLSVSIRQKAGANNVLQAALYDYNAGDLVNTLSSSRQKESTMTGGVASVTGSIAANITDLSLYNMHITVAGYAESELYSVTNVYAVKLEPGFNQTVAYQYVSGSFKEMRLIPQSPIVSDSESIDISVLATKEELESSIAALETADATFNTELNNVKNQLDIVSAANAPFIVNQNLLVNVDFGNLVYAYHSDPVMWFHNANACTIVCDKDENFIPFMKMTLTMDAVSSIFVYQIYTTSYLRVPNDFNIWALIANKTVTVSFLYKCTSTSTNPYTIINAAYTDATLVQFIFSDNEGVNKPIIADGNVHLFTCTFTVPGIDSSKTRSFFNILNPFLHKKDSELIIYGLKMEYGTQSTLAYEDENGWHLIDYKNMHLNQLETVGPTHVNQNLLYNTVFKKGFIINTANKTTYSINSSAYTEVKCNDGWTICNIHSATKGNLTVNDGYITIANETTNSDGHIQWQQILDFALITGMRYIISINIPELAGATSYICVCSQEYTNNTWTGDVTYYGENHTVVAGWNTYSFIYSPAAVDINPTTNRLFRVCLRVKQHASVSEIKMEAGVLQTAYLQSFPSLSFMNYDQYYLNKIRIPQSSDKIVGYDENGKLTPITISPRPNLLENADFSDPSKVMINNTYSSISTTITTEANKINNSVYSYILFASKANTLTTILPTSETNTGFLRITMEKNGSLGFYENILLKYFPSLFNTTFTFSVALMNTDTNMPEIYSMTKHVNINRPININVFCHTIYFWHVCIGIH